MYSYMAEWYQLQSFFIFGRKTDSNCSRFIIEFFLFWKLFGMEVKFPASRFQGWKYNSRIYIILYTLITQMEALRDSHMDVLGDNGTVNSSIQTVQANINWMNNYSDDINSWLSSKNKT